jgi:hypothetical protein
MIQPVKLPVPQEGTTRVETDRDGGFRADRLPGERFHVTVTRVGITRLRRENVTPAANVLELRVVRLGAVEGRVVFPVGAAAPERMHVWVVPAGMKPPFPTWVEGPPFCRRVDEAGRFAFPNVPAGSYDVLVTAKGFVSDRVRDVRVTAGGTADVGEITLRPE